MRTETSPLTGDPDFGKLRQYILSLTGLEYYGNREQDLASRIQRRLAARSISRVSDYLALIRGTTPESHAERDALIDAVTIGETYFFRFNEQFDALKTRLLPEILKRNQDRKTLSIWCAGCSNGSEPYTISVLLRRDFGDVLRDWDVQILGTDINARALDQAKNGWYHSWALRTLEQPQRRELFEHDSTTARYWIKQAFKRGVDFVQHNLIKDHPPIAKAGDWDLIFCRNVLIYFDAPTIEQMITRFAESLAPGGYLFLGHAEPGTGINMAQWFTTVRVPGALLYQRNGAGITPPPPGPVPVDLDYLSQFAAPTSPADTPEWTPPELDHISTGERPFLPVAPPPLPAAPPDLATVHREIRRLLDADQIHDVLTRLEPLLSSAKSYPALRHDPVLHYYQSLALEREERYQEAEAAIRSALYLDRSFLLAHYQFALMAERRGDINAALRALDTVQKIIDGSKENTRPLAQLAEIGDLTTTEMQEIVALKRATLQRLLS